MSTYVRSICMAKLQFGAQRHGCLDATLLQCIHTGALSLTFFGSHVTTTALLYLSLAVPSRRMIQ